VRCWVIIGSITDVNQNKVDEIELRNYREHLEEMVRERTLELEAVNRGVGVLQLFRLPRPARAAARHQWFQQRAAG